MYRVTRSKSRIRVFLGLVLASAAATAFAYTGQELAPEVKISLEQARAIALKLHPGKITEEGLEREKGGSGLRYSFDIRDGRRTHEVSVDAKTGRIQEQ